MLYVEKRKYSVGGVYLSLALNDGRDNENVYWDVDSIPIQCSCFLLSMLWSNRVICTNDNNQNMEGKFSGMWMLSRCSLARRVTRRVHKSKSANNIRFIYAFLNNCAPPPPLTQEVCAKGEGAAKHTSAPGGTCTRYATDQTDINLHVIIYFDEI